jgi:hypothetical protein
MTPFELTTDKITPLPTMLYGAKFFPSLEPHCSNDLDSPAWGWPQTDIEISDGNLAVVQSVLKNLGNKCQNIMEIGVHRNLERSITNILMRQKPRGCRYLGIDIDDKSHLDNPADNIFTVKANSHNKVLVRQKLRDLGMKTLDLLMIDGWHSVHTCMNDWGYVDILSNGGAVIVHDTNAHPGPVALFSAVDETLFSKQRFCTELDDMGIAVFWHKKSA